MVPWLPSLLALGVCALATTAQVAIQHHLDLTPRARALEHPDVPAYPAALISGLGRRRTAADIQWIRATEYVGNETFNEVGRPALGPLLRLVVRLDPDFKEVYYLGGLALSNETAYIEDANEIFRLGEEQFPDEWSMPFMRGANHLLVQADLERAVEAWQKTSKIPGAPTYLPQLVARLMTSEGRCLDALMTVRQFLETASPEARAPYMQRERYIRWECAMQELEKASALFQEKHGRPPASVDELRESGLVQLYFDHPFGGRWVVTETGAIRSEPPLPRLKFRKPTPGVLPPPEEQDEPSRPVPHDGTR
ncbi:MAG: hypothetical protein AB2A00_31920 [Myxococcota bacterium]